MSQIVIKQETTNAFIFVDTDEKILEVRDRYGRAQIFYIDHKFRSELIKALAEVTTEQEN